MHLHTPSFAHPTPRPRGVGISRKPAAILADSHGPGSSVTAPNHPAPETHFGRPRHPRCSDQIRTGSAPPGSEERPRTCSIPRKDSDPGLSEIYEKIQIAISCM